MNFSNVIDKRMLCKREENEVEKGRKRGRKRNIRKQKDININMHMKKAREREKQEEREENRLALFSSLHSPLILQRFAASASLLSLVFLHFIHILQRFCGSSLHLVASFLLPFPSLLFFSYILQRFTGCWNARSLSLALSLSCFFLFASSFFFVVVAVEFFSLIS